MAPKPGVIPQRMEMKFTNLLAGCVLAISAAGPAHANWYAVDFYAACTDHNQWKNQEQCLQWNTPKNPNGPWVRDTRQYGPFSSEIACRTYLDQTPLWAMHIANIGSCIPE